MSIVMVLFASALAQQEIQPPVFFAANEELKAYLIEAGENNPALHMRYDQWQAALERIPQAMSLDDPMLTYGQFLQSDMNRMKIVVAQKFPWFGTVRARRDKAAAQAEAALSRFYSMRNQVFADVKRRYFEYTFLGESIRLSAAQIEYLEFTEEIVRSKYSLALAKEDELLRVQIELTTVQDKLDSLNRVRPALSALLAETLGLAAGDDSLPWPMQASFPPGPPSSESVLATIRQANPDLSALGYLIESDAKQVELARMKGYPDFTLGIDYTSISAPRQIRPDRPFPASLHAGQRLLTGTSAGPVGTLIDLYALGNSDEPISYRSGGRDNVMFSLRINVPIWRKRVKAGIKEAQLMERAAEHEKHRKELSLGSAAQMALFGMDDALRRFNLYEESLLPKAQQTYESLQSAYGTGDTSADFLDLLDSVRQLLDFELEQIRAARDLQIAAADLELLLGRPWNEGIE